MKLTLDDLPVGTKFFVVNGAWDGEIVELDNIRYIKTVKGLKEITPSNKHTNLHIIVDGDSLKEHPDLLSKLDEIKLRDGLFEAIDSSDIPY
ncbi:hypothetical protein UT300012_22390 [Paraclostridium bifermentans]